MTHSDPTAEKNEPCIQIGNTGYPIKFLMAICGEDIDPCGKPMWEHCNETIKEAIEAEANSRMSEISDLRTRNERLEGVAKAWRLAMTALPYQDDVFHRKQDDLIEVIEIEYLSDKKGTV